MPDSVSLPEGLVFPDGTVTVLRNRDSYVVYLVSSWNGSLSVLTIPEETAVALGRTLIEGGSRIPMTSEN